MDRREWYTQNSWDKTHSTINAWRVCVALFKMLYIVVYFTMHWKVKQNTKNINRKKKMCTEKLQLFCNCSLSLSVSSL